MILIDPLLWWINYIDPLVRLSDLLPIFSSVQTELMSLEYWWNICSSSSLNGEVVRGAFLPLLLVLLVGTEIILMFFRAREHSCTVYPRNLPTKEQGTVHYGCHIYLCGKWVLAYAILAHFSACSDTIHKQLEKYWKQSMFAQIISCGYTRKSVKWLEFLVSVFSTLMITMTSTVKTLNPRFLTSQTFPISCCNNLSGWCRRICLFGHVWPVKTKCLGVHGGPLLELKALHCAG